MEAEIIPSIPKKKIVIVVVKVKMKLEKKSDVKLIYCYILDQKLLVYWTLTKGPCDSVYFKIVSM